MNGFAAFLQDLCFAIACAPGYVFFLLASMLWSYAFFCLPVFLLLRLAFAVVWKVRGISPPRVLGLADAAALLAAPFVWGALEHVGQGKSLSNLAIELAVIGWVWCLCLGVRYFLATKDVPRRPGSGGLPTLAAVLLAAALLAVFFPVLPE